MLPQVQAIQLQIQDLYTLYFLTYILYFVDRYNVIWDVCKYLREYCLLVLTYDNKQHTKSIANITHEKIRIMFGGDDCDDKQKINSEDRLPKGQEYICEIVWQGLIILRSSHKHRSTEHNTSTGV